MIAPAPNLGAARAAHHPRPTTGPRATTKGLTMTNAQSGLRAALARRGKVGISHLTGAEIVAQLTDGQRAAIAAKLGVRAAPARPKAKWSAELAASPEARAEKQRAIDVINSPHFAANRDLAITLYRNPKLSAGEINSMLALAAAENPTEENAALTDMRAALAQARERNGAIAGSQESNPAKAADLWARAYAKLELDQ